LLSGALRDDRQRLDDADRARAGAGSAAACDRHVCGGTLQDPARPVRGGPIRSSGVQRRDEWRAHRHLGCAGHPSRGWWRLFIAAQYRAQALVPVQHARRRQNSYVESRRSAAALLVLMRTAPSTQRTPRTQRNLSVLIGLTFVSFVSLAVNAFSIAGARPGTIRGHVEVRRAPPIER